MFAKMQVLRALCLLLPAFAQADFKEDVHWLVANQRYDLVLNPETLAQLSAYPFATYIQNGETRAIISDRDDGLWRVETDLKLRQTYPAEADLGNLPGDQHTLSFSKAQNILIERLDIYAHAVEEALKFSACANIVVRNCRLIAGRQSEDALNIVRGQNYIFDSVWLVGLGDRAMTIKGSARWVDMIDSVVGLQSPDDFHTLFGDASVVVGNHTFSAGDLLLPRETIPSWIAPCLLFSSDRALGIELGGWSDYDIGYLNAEGVRETRPPTADIRLQAHFIHSMEDLCDTSPDLVPVLSWHTVERVNSDAWIFQPTEIDLLGDLIETIYYEESEPSAEQEQALRESLGEELDYVGVELPRYWLKPGASGNNRFFGALYNHDNRFFYAPSIGWIFVYREGPMTHEAMLPGTWMHHYNSASYLLFLAGETLRSSIWWNASTASYAWGPPD